WSRGVRTWDCRFEVGRWVLPGSVERGEFAGHDRPRPRQAAAIREVADEREHADEHRQLEDVGEGHLWQSEMHQPQHRLGDGDGPDAAVEVASLVALAG